LQCAAVCCSVLQCAAVCCSVLQCAAVCCSVLQCAAVCCNMLPCAAVCCTGTHLPPRPWITRVFSRVLQCVIVCCSVLQCAALCCSVLQYAAVCCVVLQCVAVYCSVLQCVAVCCSVLQSFHRMTSQDHGQKGCVSRMRHFQCAAVCCSVLQCVAVCCSVLQCVAVWCSVSPDDEPRPWIKRMCLSAVAGPNTLYDTSPCTVLSTLTLSSATSTCMLLTEREMHTHRQAHSTYKETDKWHYVLGSSALSLPLRARVFLPAAIYPRPATASNMF